MNKNKRKILLLEDDYLFAQTIIDFLEENDYKVDHVDNGESALELSYENIYDIYLLDINVPKLNGIEVLKEIRQKGIQTPSIFLTSYKDEDTLNKCFENGCDDYLRKPFKINELLLRISAILKRTVQVNNVVKLNTSTIYDFDKRKIYIDNIEQQTPLKIIQLLELFIEYNNKTISSDIIINSLWSNNEDYSEGSIRNYILSLRKIVGKDKIINVKKVGYEIIEIIDE
ncbi:MAG: response regulator transcription factor [Campylobacteraceae bacterium]|jgi:DNA-binding response OmpR family regulator|nr:response regulator transcription factor [Campylobacteraceae bacterium]MBT3882422.1 response regulator transcription factor [Campylobacteraceae bacterium]MBT4031228.1 response regulator transcription factor [Campylobacteraceae bacterium]MBT4179535.1 response regulator transcription factor [Campylobacteraceae bacterium]MBT4572804.1 response regulator transcription factor [Campylobacteraceae bacterium]